MVSIPHKLEFGLLGLLQVRSAGAAVRVIAQTSES
jgi:hypothetical protein